MLDSCSLCVQNICYSTSRGISTTLPVLPNLADGFCITSSYPACGVFISRFIFLPSIVTSFFTSRILILERALRFRLLDCKVQLARYKNQVTDTQQGRHQSSHTFINFIIILCNNYHLSTSSGGGARWRSCLRNGSLS